MPATTSTYFTYCDAHPLVSQTSLACDRKCLQGLRQKQFSKKGFKLKVDCVVKIKHNAAVISFYWIFLKQSN